jgi:hypothetical protein
MEILFLCWSTGRNTGKGQTTANQSLNLAGPHYGFALHVVVAAARHVSFLFLLAFEGKSLVVFTFERVVKKAQ